MSEGGGPVAQAAIRYQNQVAALHMGRMLDPRERDPRHRPVEVRVETPEDVDDFAVRYADGSRRLHQVKLTLRSSGEAWRKLWVDLRSQLAGDASPDTRIALVLGGASSLASNLQEMVSRLDGADATEWRVKRLNKPQAALSDGIGSIIGGGDAEVMTILSRLDVEVVPASTLERDQLALWLPPSSADGPTLFRELTRLAWEGAATRTRFDGPTLRDRLASEAGITIADASRWGTEKYRSAIARVSRIEVPGTGFARQAADDFLWPRCREYEHGRRSDFDDDLPGWRQASDGAPVDLASFPGPDLTALVVIAGPGFGKSTLVNAIARGVSSRGLVPAVVPIVDLADTGLAIAEHLERRTNADYDVAVDWRAAADTGALVLLLDGLDEVSSRSRTAILEKLRAFTTSHPGVRWILTVRDASALASPEGARMVELVPLRPEDIPSYAAFYRPGEKGVAAVLRARLDARPDLASLVSIPIFLALMLVLKLEGEDPTRGNLLEHYLATLFRPDEHKSVEHDEIGSTVLRRVSELAAFEALENETIGVDDGLLARCLQNVAPELRVDAVRGALIRRGVLRRTSPVRMAIAFPIVQGFLASVVLLERGTDELAGRLHRIVERPWAQAIQFALERHPDPAPLVEAMIESEDDAFHTNLRLLGRCIANGMKVTAEQRGILGERLAAIWGGSAWRSNRLIDAIIVDAFSEPLHPAIRRRLGERHLLGHGSGTIVARHRDDELTMAVLDELLAGDLDHFYNLDGLQREVDRLGSAAFGRYIARTRAEPQSGPVAGSTSTLIQRIAKGRVDPDIAEAAARDPELAPEVRLAAWSHVGKPLDDEMQMLTLDAMETGEYRRMSAAAEALSSPEVPIGTIVGLLRSDRLTDESALQVLDYLVGDWKRADKSERIGELAADPSLTDGMADILRLYLVGLGDRTALDGLVERLHILDPDMLKATVSMFGHFLERGPVERAVEVIWSRTWDAHDRVAMASALSIGLTFRMEMIGLRSGSLHDIPLHPGRSVPAALIEEWLALADYSPRQHLDLAMDAIRLGVPSAAARLRAIFESALAAPKQDETAEGAMLGQALEALHDQGENFALRRLEEIAGTSTYNLATSAVAVIAKGGGRDEVDALIRVHAASRSGMLRSVILTELEPLAGRLALRITRSGRGLSVASIR